MAGNASIIFILSYLSLNFLLILLLSPSKINYLLMIHVIIIFILFILSLINIVKKRKRSDILKKMDSSSKSSYLFANYVQNAGHILFCYFGFFYLYLILLLVVYKFKKIKIKRNIIILVLATGFVLAFKETFLQFSQCLTAGFSSFDYPMCDKHYYKFWNCVQNKTFEKKKNLIRTEEE